MLNTLWSAPLLAKKLTAALSTNTKLLGRDLVKFLAKSLLGRQTRSPAIAREILNPEEDIVMNGTASQVLPLLTKVVHNHKAGAGKFFTINADVVDLSGHTVHVTGHVKVRDESFLSGCAICEGEVLYFVVIDGHFMVNDVPTIGSGPMLTHFMIQ